MPRGQTSVAWFSAAALLAMILMVWTARRYAELSKAAAAAAALKPVKAAASAPVAPAHTKGQIAFAITILVILLFSKNAYSSSFSSYYTFYLIGKFGISVQGSQLMLFLFLAAAAVGALAGGIIGDKIGRNRILWFSILGALPFSLMLPFADLFWTGVLTVVINLIMASSFAAILIYAMELMPGRIGLIGGLFYGLSFGLGGLAAAILGEVADWIGIEAVYRICAGCWRGSCPRSSTGGDRIRYCASASRIAPFRRADHACGISLAARPATGSDFQ